MRTLVYDGAGNVVEKHFPDAIAKYTFDLAGRSLSEDWDGDGKPEVTRTWDSSPEHPARQLDRGKLVLVTEPSGSTSHEYDERGRVAATTVTIDGKAYTSGSRYDNQDREAEHIYPDGSSIRIDRNARGQLANYANGAVSFEYDGDGLELTRRFGTGVVQTNGYDTDRRMNELTATDARGEVIEHLKWTFDAAGNVSNLADLRAGVPKSDDRSEAYVYDNLYRLTGAQGAWGHTEWKYSPSGDLLERKSTVPGQQSGAIEYRGLAPHAPSRIGQRALVFDARGRLTSDGDRTYTWNVAEQLERVASTSGASEENKFDAEGIRRVRVEKSKDGVERRVEFISPWSEVEDGQLVRFIVHGGRRIVRLAEDNGVDTSARLSTGTNAASSFSGKSAALGRALGNFGQMAMVAVALIALAWSKRARWLPLAARLATALAVLLVVSCSSDGRRTEAPVAPEDRGTVQALSDGDTVLLSDQLGSLLAEASATKGVTGRFAAYPFGATRYDSSPQTRKFANSTRDIGVGLDLMGARVYAPDLGIWTSGDPVLVNAPEKVATSDFATANPYAYANLNPVVAADQDGHFWHILAGAAIGAVVGGGIEAARQYIANGKIDDWGRVGAAAAGGAVSGALTAACPAAGLAGVMAVGAGSGAAAGVTQRLVESGGQSAGTLKEVVVDATVGAATAGLAKGVMAVGKAVVQRVAPKAAGAVTKVASQCFAGETLVETAEGLRRIDEIRPGDLVLSRDEESGIEELRAVVQVFVTPDQPLVEVRIKDGKGYAEVLRATSEHPFWVDGQGWVSTADLAPGDHLITSDDSGATVVGTTSAGSAADVYNLEVEGVHTYFVGHGRAWVHNKCGETGGTASRPPRNGHLAGETHPKTNVPFDADGYPNFSAYRHPDVPDVRIELSGSRSTDFARANAAAGLEETPAGYTWHHHQDKGLMQLIERKIHAATGHTGGFSGP
jgi:RHS repeat-associated protein